jgi:uncharacterized protein YkwD
MMGWLKDLMRALFGDPAPPPVVPVVPTPSRPDLVSGQMLALHNRERTARGIRALAADARLASAAQVHANECATWGRLDHAGWDKEIGAAGYPMSAIGQNLAEGPADAAVAFNMLMADPPHRANILNPAFSRMGAGMAIGKGMAFFAVNYGGD